MKRSQQNIEQQDIQCLIIILDNWLPLLCQMQAIQDNLHSLPAEIDTLNNFNIKAITDSEKVLLTNKILSLLENIDAEIPRLIRLEEKINNLIFAREILEALQQKINNDYNQKYELNFKQIQLINASDRLKKQKYLRNYRGLKLIENSPKTITKFWNKHYRLASIVFGVVAITFYGWFSYYSAQENPERNRLNNVNSKTERVE